VVEILGWLPSITAVHEVILAHRYIDNVHQGSERQILSAIFRRQYYNASKHDSRMKEDLRSAISLGFVKTEVVEHLFTIGWAVFRKEGREGERLCLCGWLARTYCLEHREDRAVSLLQKLVHSVEASTRCNLLSPGLLPLLELLDKLTHSTFPFDDFERFALNILLGHKRTERTTMALDAASENLQAAKTPTSLENRIPELSGKDRRLRQRIASYRNLIDDLTDGRWHLSSV